MTGSARHILLAEIMHESNTFNRIPTTKKDFESRYYLTDEAVAGELEDTNTEIWGVLSSAAKYGWRVTHPLAASASPSGPMTADAWAEIKRLILAPILAGEKFDAIFLVLHGAMVTQTSDDPEGELLAAVHDLVGANVPIMVTLDMHANVSKRMVAHSTAMMAYRTYPHVDQFERAVHLMEILKKILDDNLEVSQHFMRRPMMDAADHGQTANAPMQRLLKRASEIEARPGILCASVQIGFPWADVADIGPSVLVTGAHEANALCMAGLQELADAVWETRNETQLNFASIDDAMEAAELGKPGEAPLILADFADNPAGGAYGDSPNLLRAMLEAKLENAAFATICDPVSVAAAAVAGEGQTVTLKLGGVHSPDITPPLELTVLVVKIAAGEFVCEGPMWTGVRFSMGQSAVVRSDGVEFIISSVPVAVMDRQVFLSVGIDPAMKTTIGLKSRNHFKAAYEPLSRAVMLVDAGGIASMQLESLPYEKIHRPIWPLDKI